MNTANIFGIKVACLDLDGILACVQAWIEMSELAQQRTVAYANAHVLNLAWEDDAFKQLLLEADLVYADGIGAAWAGRWLGGCCSIMPWNCRSSTSN